MTTTSKFIDPEHTTLKASFDGEVVSGIPAIEGNRHYDRVMRESVPQNYVHPDASAEMIRSEAERRIALGTVFGGEALRCDDRSFLRISQIRQTFRDGAAPAEGYLTRTDAGVLLEIDSLAKADAIYAAMAGHQAFVMRRSAELQSGVRAVIVPIDSDENWAEGDL